MAGQCCNGLSIAALGDEEHSASDCVGRQGHVVVPPGPRGLVDGQRGEFAEVGQPQRDLDVAIDVADGCRDRVCRLDP